MAELWRGLKTANLETLRSAPQVHMGVCVWGGVFWVPSAFLFVSGQIEELQPDPGQFLAPGFNHQLRLL